MLPEKLLQYRLIGDEIVPQFLDSADHPWLRSLLEEYGRFVGRRRRELDARLNEPLPVASPVGKRRAAIHVLSHLWRAAPTSAIPPQRARAAVFSEATRTPDEPHRVLVRVASELHLTVAELEDALFADLPGERQLAPPVEELSPGELALRTNLALAQALLFRSSRVRLAVDGNARAVVRQAKLGGLICSVAPHRQQGCVVLEVSGPYALFKRTLLYGRALGRLVPVLAWTRAFRMTADCTLRHCNGTLVLRSGDPIFPSAEPRRFDSKLEERFARDFVRLTTAWNVIREPEPARADGALVFRDFAIEHRETKERWLLEIAGFWTPAYLTRKLAQYRAARLDRLILCISEELNCGEEELPEGTPVLRFRRRVDAKAVLRLLEGFKRRLGSPTELPGSARLQVAEAR